MREKGSICAWHVTDGGSERERRKVPYIARIRVGMMDLSTFKFVPNHQ